MDIQSHPFFDNIDPHRIRVLVDATSVRTVADQEVIFAEGDASDALYLILQGRIAFRKKLPSGELLTVSFGSEGNYFGEIGVLTGEPRALQAVGAGEAVIAEVPGSALVEFLNDLAGPVENLLQSVIKHLHATTRHYMDDMLRQEKMTVVGNMMNTILHDFKNPFCLISLSAQLLRQKNPDSETERLCVNIEQQVDRMVEMANELSEYSRGEQNFEKSRVPLDDLFNEFRDLNFPFFEDEHVMITVDLPRADLLGEKNKLMRVFQNLVGNAIEALEEREGTIRISGKVLRDEHQLELQIADNGDGIPEAIRDRFFEPFVTHGKTRGTGLGTAIVKSIVDAHGGSIHFETETGKGTTFFIRLPLA